ncbi:hypothetical protein [Galbibacter pacificus]|nr:hypothetical protein [Galbibacter pacificus]
MIYQFDLLADGNSYREALGSDKSYGQSISITLPMLDRPTNEIMEALLNSEFRVILELNNGIYKIFGLENGLSVDSVKLVTGGAKSEFNGYTFNFEGREEKESFYIDDLEEAGFIPYSPTLYEFQDFILHVFQDNELYNFN